TPKSGPEVRENIKAVSADYKDKLSDINDQLRKVKVSIQSLKAESQVMIPRTVKDVKESVEKWQSDTAPLQQQLQNEISSIQTAIDELEQALPKKKEVIVTN
ncbi:MAG: YtxH domain-containing protein, partial [Psychrobacillus sp.]